MPGIVACTRDVMGSDGSHPPNAGPCVRFTGMETFLQLDSKLSGCGTGAGLAKDRAAAALTKVEIPDEADY